MSSAAPATASSACSTMWSGGSRSGIYLSVAHHKRQDRLVISWCTATPRLCDGVTGAVQPLPSQQLIDGYVCDVLTKAFSSAPMRTLLSVRRLANTTPLPLFVELLDANGGGDAENADSGDGTKAEHAYVHVALFLATLQYLEHAMAAGSGGRAAGGGVAINFVGCSFRRCRLSDRELHGLASGVNDLVQQWLARAATTARMPLGVHAIANQQHPAEGGLTAVEFCFADNAAVSTASIPLALRCLSNFVDSLIVAGSSHYSGGSNVGGGFAQMARRHIKVVLDLAGTEAAAHPASPQIAASTGDICSHKCGGLLIQCIGLPPLPLPKPKQQPTHGDAPPTPRSGATTPIPHKAAVRSSSAPNTPSPPPLPHHQHAPSPAAGGVRVCGAGATAAVPKTVGQLFAAASSAEQDHQQHQQQQIERRRQQQEEHAQSEARNQLAAALSFFSLYELLARYTGIIVAEQRQRAQLLSRWAEEVDFVFGSALDGGGGSGVGEGDDGSASPARAASFSAARARSMSQQPQQQRGGNNGVEDDALLDQIGEALVECNGMVLSLRRSISADATPLLQELDTTLLPMLAQAASAAVSHCAIARPAHLRAVMARLREPLIADVWCGFRQQLVESCTGTAPPPTGKVSAAAAVSDAALSALCADVFSLWSTAGGNPAVVVGRAFDVVEAALEPLQAWHAKIGAVSQRLLREAFQVMGCHVVLLMKRNMRKRRRIGGAAVMSTVAAGCSKGLSQDPQQQQPAKRRSVSAQQQQQQRNDVEDRGAAPVVEPVPVAPPAPQQRQHRPPQPLPPWGSAFAAGAKGKRSNSPAAAASSTSRSGSAADEEAQPQQQRQRRQVTKLSVKDFIAQHTHNVAQPPPPSSAAAKQQPVWPADVAAASKAVVASKSGSNSNSSQSVSAAVSAASSAQRADEADSFRLPEPTLAAHPKRLEPQHSVSPPLEHRSRQHSHADDDGDDSSISSAPAPAPAASPIRLQMLRNGWRSTMANRFQAAQQPPQDAAAAADDAFDDGFIDVAPPAPRAASDRRSGSSRSGGRTQAVSVSPEPQHVPPPPPIDAAATRPAAASRSANGARSSKSNSQGAASKLDALQARTASASVPQEKRPSAAAASPPHADAAVSPARLLRALLRASSSDGSRGRGGDNGSNDDVVELLRAAVSLARSSQARKQPSSSEAAAAASEHEHGVADQRLSSLERALNGEPWRNHHHAATFEAQEQTSFTPPRFTVRPSAWRRSTNNAAFHVNQQQQHVYRTRDVALIDRLLARHPRRRFFQPGEDYALPQKQQHFADPFATLPTPTTANPTTPMRAVGAPLSALGSVSLNRASGTKTGSVASDLLKSIRNFAACSSSSGQEQRVAGNLHNNSPFVAAVVDPAAAREQTELQRRSLALHNDILSVLDQMEPRMKAEAERRARALVSEI